MKQNINKQAFNKKPKETKLKVKEPMELMAFLLEKMGGMSRSSIKSLLSHRRVSVDDKITTQYNAQLRTGNVVTVSSSRGNVELVHSKLKIMYEDNDIIVVEKKEGLLTVSTGKENETTAFSILKNHVKKASTQNRIYTVHRLDRETSGVLVFAKSKEIQLAMQENWHQTVTKRVYVALVEGKIEKESDVIRTWLTENEKSLKIHSSIVDKNGQEAITRYKRIKYNEEYSLLEIELETGRKNQIRVHMQDIGHPIVGDKKYGAQTTSPIKRMGLHARILEFYHPSTKKIVKFETVVPRSFLHLFH